MEVATAVVLWAPHSTTFVPAIDEAVEGIGGRFLMHNFPDVHNDVTT